MRGRPLKEDKKANLDDTVRRARGRAAQRRYRHRKEQTLAETKARNDKLEAIVEGMAKAFFHFGDHVVHPKAAISPGDLGSAYREVVRTFLDLTAEVNEKEGWSQNASPDLGHENNSHTTGPKTTLLSGQTPADMESSLCISSESASAEVFPDAEKAKDKILGLHRTTLPDVKIMSPGIILMPIQNPLLSSDYSALEELSYPEPSLRKRLLRHGLLRSYRALECSPDLPEYQKSWFARSHHFSLQHATRWHLLFLTKLGIDKMIYNTRTTVYGPPAPTNSSLNDVFDTSKHRELARAVLNDLEREGIWSEILRGEDVEDYIATKGHIKLDGNRLELRLFSQKQSRFPSPNKSSADTDVQIVILDTEKLIRKLCDESICLGDDLGIPKRIINDAIVYSAVHISHHL